MLDTTVIATPDTETATAAQVWAQLGTAPTISRLPNPDSITVNGHHTVRIYLHDSAGHTLTDLHTWVAWIGAHDLTTSTYGSSRSGYVQRDTSAAGIWRGWEIKVIFIEVIPVEAAAVAYGQSAGA